MTIMLNAFAQIIKSTINNAPQLFIAFAIGTTSLADETQRWNPPGQLARLVAPAQGGPLCAPVRIGNTTHVFLLDTGSSITFVDQAIIRDSRLSKVRDVSTTTISGKTAISLYAAPKMYVCNTSCDSLVHVGGIDLGPFRSVSGLPIKGILGLDYLHQFILHCDYENEVVLICDPLKCTTPPGKPIDAASHSDGRLYIPVQLSKDLTEYFLIDTGCQSSNVINRESFDRYLNTGVIADTGISSTSVEGDTKTHVNPLARCKSVIVGGYPIKGMIVSTANKNALGIPFLVGFRTTLDFKGGKVYLAPSRAYGLRDRSDYNGLVLSQSREERSVLQVIPGSIADFAGFHVGDKVVAVNNILSANITVPAMIQLLTLPTKDEQRFEILRGSRKLVLCIPGG